MRSENQKILKDSGARWMMEGAKAVYISVCNIEDNGHEDPVDALYTALENEGFTPEYGQKLNDRAIVVRNAGFIEMLRALSLINENPTVTIREAERTAEEIIRASGNWKKIDNDQKMVINAQDIKGMPGKSDRFKERILVSALEEIGFLPTVPTDEQARQLGYDAIIIEGPNELKRLVALLPAPAPAAVERSPVTSRFSPAAAPEATQEGYSYLKIRNSGTWQEFDAGGRAFIRVRDVKGFGDKEGPVKERLFLKALENIGFRPQMASGEEMGKLGYDAVIIESRTDVDRLRAAGVLAEAASAVPDLTAIVKDRGRSLKL